MINFRTYEEKLYTHIWKKNVPNTREKNLFKKAQKYCNFLKKIPGIEMIAVVNSLSMYSTHEDSDIDLFIITKKHSLWFVRFFSTLLLLFFREWRHGKNISSKFCLSFFIDTSAMDFREIMIPDDIYLYYWIVNMKPLVNKNFTYEKFLEKNSWVKISDEEKKENKKYLILEESDFFCTGCIILNACKKVFFWCINYFLFLLLFPKTYLNYLKKWKPNGVIISKNMLKFHDKDRREELQENLLKKD